MDKVKLKFEYTYECGDEIKLEKTDSVDTVNSYGGELHYIIDSFKVFLTTSGFSPDIVRNIILVER